MTLNNKTIFIISIVVGVFLSVEARCQGVQPPAAGLELSEEVPSALDIMPSEKWHQIDQSVDRALAWLAEQQQGNGSFHTEEVALPAVTSLCAMAFLARGHLPNEGKYGEAIQKAIDFVMTTQKADGLITMIDPRKRGSVSGASQSAPYNHAIAGMMLAEAYAMTTGEVSKKIEPCVRNAVAFSLRREPGPKKRKDDEGGWRYIGRMGSGDSDLSVTSWQLMFLRSAKNAGFDVPAKVIEEALGYVHRSYDPERHVFQYTIDGGATRGMVAAGVLSLSLAGQHGTVPAKRAGNWLLAHPFDEYKRTTGGGDRFFYAAFYYSHAVFQLGGTYWKEGFPVLANTLVSNQRPDGSWHGEVGGDEKYGKPYTAALSVLALSPQYQLLPIFQR